MSNKLVGAKYGDAAEVEERDIVTKQRLYKKKDNYCCTCPSSICVRNPASLSGGLINQQMKKRASNNRPSFSHRSVTHFTRKGGQKRVQLLIKGRRIFQICSCIGGERKRRGREDPSVDSNFQIGSRYTDHPPLPAPSPPRHPQQDLDTPSRKMGSTR